MDAHETLPHLTCVDIYHRLPLIVFAVLASVVTHRLEVQIRRGWWFGGIKCTFLPQRRGSC
jgi:hypothetical protein